MSFPQAWAVATADAVFEVHAAVLTEFETLTAGSGLTPSLARGLWALDPEDGPLPRRTVAERLGCDPSNVTLLADRLEQQRLVRRTRDPADGRVRALELTAKGRDLRQRLAQALVVTLGPGGSAADALARLALLARSSPTKSPSTPAPARSDAQPVA